MVTFNVEIKLEKPFSVAEMTNAERIIFLPKRNVIVVKSNKELALKHNAREYNNEGIILSARSAAKEYPQYFTGYHFCTLSKGHKFLVNLSEEQYQYCAASGNAGAFIRDLIDRAMNDDL